MLVKLEGGPKDGKWVNIDGDNPPKGLCVPVGVYRPFDWDSWPITLDASSNFIQHVYHRHWWKDLDGVIRPRYLHESEQPVEGTACITDKPIIVNEV